MIMKRRSGAQQGSLELNKKSVITHSIRIIRVPKNCYEVAHKK